MSGKKDKNEFKYFVNFIIFGYLIHYSLLYNREYYLWRLKNFNEKDIFNKNKEYVLSLAGVGKKCIKSEILIREIKDYKKLLEDKNKIINAYKTDLDKKTGIINTQKEKINGFVEEIKKRENIISKQAQQIEHLHNEINKKNEIIDTQKEQMKNELAKKDEVIHNYARQIDKLNSQLKNKNIEVKKLNEKINVLNNEIYEIYSSKTYKLASMLRNIKRRIW